MAGQILVLADDLSGAAELAGIACTLGLTAEVHRQFEPASQAAVIAIDSDTRSLPEALAVQRVHELAHQIATMKPAWIFKKVDSILRGHSRAEIEALLAVTKQPRAILIPANPSRGRVIAQGRYLVDGVPLDQTTLASDPDYPRQSASVRVLLDKGGLSIHQLDAPAPLPADGIAVPDILGTVDIQRRASELDSITLPAGAADFFAAILKSRLHTPPQALPQPHTLLVRLPALLVCGSFTAWQARNGECRAAELPVITMADDPLTLPSALRNTGAAVLTSGGQFVAEDQRGSLLSDLADHVAFILEKSPVVTLLVEGGATAAAVAKRLNWSRFDVSAPGPFGVGVLRPISDSPAPRVLMKPGSYPWPAEIWGQLGRRGP